MTALLSTTLFLSAWLMFTVEPMVGKMVLPAFGGTPGVWNTCLLFFQAALLAGYGYAHGIGRSGRLRWQALPHLGVLAAGTLVIPLVAVIGVQQPSLDYPALWLLRRLAVSLGLPFFAIAATAPLLQKWLAQSGSLSGRDPYFLYAASNAGSLIALAGYPFVMERLFDLNLQVRIWTSGYMLLMALVGLCALFCGKASTATRSGQDSLVRQINEPLDTAVNRSMRFWWMILSAVPSSLMMGVTAHITTNVASVPLLWVGPMAIYLLTFILAFARHQLISAELMSAVLPFIALPLGPLLFISIPDFEWRVVAANLVMFFVMALLCHGQLARRRPAARHLTQYYLWIAIGGVVGGMFNALLAPAIFKTVIEYPLAICAACMLRIPGQRKEGPLRPKDWILPMIAGFLAIAAVLLIRQTPVRGTWTGLAIVFAVVVIPALFLRREPILFGVVYASGLLAFALYTFMEQGNLLHIERNFFGVKQVVTSGNGGMHYLYHGTTIHGVQRMDRENGREPLAYYHRRGPVGELFQMLASSQPKARIAAVGLGVGAVAAYVEAGQYICFYEIDPAVARIASNPEWFTYLSQCRGRYDIVLGDGRLKLAQAPAARYQLILLDAYSSDAVPVHLLSREALHVYLSKLADGGILAFHTTNRFMDLTGVLAGLARDAHLECRVRTENWAEMSDEERGNGCFAAQVVVMARNVKDLAPLTASSGWLTAVVDPVASVWTDRYSDVIGVMISRKTDAGWYQDSPKR